MKRSHAHDMLARVRREFVVTRYSVEAVEGNWSHHHKAEAIVRLQLTVGDVRRCLVNIEITYILNLFVTFEAILREYWTSGLGRTTVPEVRSLIESIGARRRIDPPTLAAVHAVRTFRNEIAHRNTRVLRFDFDRCAKELGKYLSWLPERW
jgi:hypothetical protein